MRPNAWIMELAPGVSIMAPSSAPRRDRASVGFGLSRLKSCPQGQLDHPHYPFPGRNTHGLPARRREARP